MAGALSIPVRKCPDVEPGVVQAGNAVDDRPPVGMTGPEAAPLVRDAQPLGGGQRGDQAIHDRLDHVGLDRRVLIPDIEGAADQQPPVLKLGGDGRHDAGQPDRRGLGDQQVALDPVGRDARAAGRRAPAAGPVANTTDAGVRYRRPTWSTVTSRPPRTVTAVAATPVATPGTPAASLATARSGLTRAWCRISAPSMGRARFGTSLSTSPGASHSTAGGWWAAKPPGCGARPIQSMSTSPTPPGSRCSSSRHRSRLACSRSTSGSGSLHRCGSGISRPLAPPVAPVPRRPVSISSTEPRPGLGTGGRRGHAQDAAADDQDVRARSGNGCRRRGRGPPVPPR